MVLDNHLTRDEALALSVINDMRPVVIAESDTVLVFLNGIEMSIAAFEYLFLERICEKGHSPKDTYIARMNDRSGIEYKHSSHSRKSIEDMFSAIINRNDPISSLGRLVERFDEDYAEAVEVLETRRHRS